MKVLPTSFSALDSFETCPRKHYLTRLAKLVADPPGEAMQWGNTVHKALEKYLSKGVSLPATIEQYRPYADMIKKKFDDAELLVENQLAVREDFEPTGWWDKDGWFRGIIDVALIKGDTAYLFDWKTGKQKDNMDQLHMFSALIVAHYPQVKTIHTAFIWLQPKTITTETYTSDEARKFWATLAPRVAHLEYALENDKWPPRPSGLCRNWCPVGVRNCEHCGG